MECSCYLRNGVVYIPTEGMVDIGFYREIEPVAVVPVANTSALHQAFADTMMRGNPKVPVIRGREFPPPVVLKYAGVKSWRAFARGTSSWTLGERNGFFRIQGYRKDGGGWVPDQNAIESFPLGTSTDQVIDRMIAILQEAARRDQPR
jgi:hypothetical protein